MQRIHMKQNINIYLSKCEKVGLDHFNDPKAFMEYSNDMQDVQVYNNVIKSIKV